MPHWLSASTYHSRKKHLSTTGKVFLEVRRLSVTQPTVPLHWRKLIPTSETNPLLSVFHNPLWVTSVEKVLLSFLCWLLDASTGTKGGYFVVETILTVRLPHWHLCQLIICSKKNNTLLWQFAGCSKLLHATGNGERCVGGRVRGDTWVGWELGSSVMRWFRPDSSLMANTIKRKLAVATWWHSNASQLCQYNCPWTSSVVLGTSDNHGNEKKTIKQIK